MTVTVDAPVEQVLAFLRDIDHQQDWFPGNTESEVLERDEQGRATKARLVNDVKVAKDEFVLDYTHTDSGFSWVLPEPTKIQKVQQGSWTLTEQDGKTVATMALSVDTTLPLPGFVQRKTVKDTLKNATKAVVAHF
jgi:ribosome-associated toxin RatA of RatAB toxin-antitoxin module